MSKVVPSQHLQEKVASSCSDLAQVLDFSSVLVCVRINRRLKDYPHAPSKVIVYLAYFGADLID